MSSEKSGSPVTLKPGLVVALAALFLALTANTAMGDKTCTAWQAHTTHRALDIRFCHELDSKGEASWFTFELRNRYDRAVDASGDIFWSDGVKEHFWALLKPGEESGSLCTQCRKKHPTRPVRWEIKRFELN